MTDVVPVSGPAMRLGAAPGAARRVDSTVVAFQGERGAYGDVAIEARWGRAALRWRCWDFDEVTDTVAAGHAEFGVLPMHNAIIGEIAGVRALIARSALQIVGEIAVPIRHSLMAPALATMETLRDVYSQAAALAQCGAFLARHPTLRGRESYDTAGAAREVAARGKPSEGAIAPPECATMYGLQILRSDVGDREDNTTNFVVVACDLQDSRWRCGP